PPFANVRRCGRTRRAPRARDQASSAAPGKKNRMSAIATTAPTNCIRTNIGTDDGRMPAKLSDNVRAMVTAGLPKLVEDVNQQAPRIHGARAKGTARARPLWTHP